MFLIAGTLIASTLFGRHRRLRIASIIFGFIVAASVAWKFAVIEVADLHWLADFAVPWSPYGARYLYVPIVMVAFCFITMIFEKPLPLRSVGVVVSGLVLFTSIQHGFARSPWADFSKEWKEKAPLIGKVPVVVQVRPGWELQIPAHQTPAADSGEPQHSASLDNR